MRDVVGQAMAADLGQFPVGYLLPARLRWTTTAGFIIV
jgi:hypothetical protein